MSVAKTIEVTSASPKSFKDAVQRGVERAARTVDGITGAWVSEQKVLVADGEVTEYRVTLRVTFLLSEES